ncbi:chorismate-binding protein [Micromonospora sp. HUAS LYJ1]|uniref:chorismate-binding protein n=1 Tax=Micromonospora sp. HUAS LYJ1 TaxID=3061626 RepID=UPI0026731680|nr:chorismate-binding protein [Micromonospora sp. HUAS LYJ1]WKU03017.1 chorismate-binding protein [Micromonospora sp. HUAS LYJ1]
MSAEHRPAPSGPVALPPADRAGCHGPFALLHRPYAHEYGWVDVLAGPVAPVDRLAELPLPEPADPAEGQDLLVLIPYRQLAERGFDAPDDGTPLLAMRVEQQEVLPLAEVLRRIPDGEIPVGPGDYDLSDAAYAGLVHAVLDAEIGSGQGANFVLKRTWIADLGGDPLTAALRLFRRLLAAENGAYWTFLVHTGDRTLVGASPERHVSLTGGRAVMNPISGTYRYPESGPTLPGVLDFLATSKETAELFMVVDEELKMMARICPDGARVRGPYLREMARLAHTEYLVEGATDADVRDVLRETMFAPTVVGSPLQNATRVIGRYEPTGRAYYSGALALIGHDRAGRRTLDSTIVIRTADIDSGGRLRLSVGATLVRDSDPVAEAAETRAKAAGLLTALHAQPVGGLAGHPGVRRALRQRNERVGRFWLASDQTDAGDPYRPGDADPVLDGRRVLVVDAEDTFAVMLGQQLRSLGLDVTVRRHDEPFTVDAYDLVVLGPGPGDPRDGGDPRVRLLRDTIGALLAGRRPFLAVCLSHQVLCDLLGIPLHRLPVPNQGVQKEIRLFGVPHRVAFYNTFTGRCPTSLLPQGRHAETVQVSRDPATGEVYALRAAGFASVQFHPESILTEDGVGILRELLRVLPQPGAGRACSAVGVDFRR